MITTDAQLPCEPRLGNIRALPPCPPGSRRTRRSRDRRGRFFGIAGRSVKWEEEMTYRITYIDTSSSPTREQRVAETVRTEDYTSERAALARARE